MSYNDVCDILVIGGGAAGMFASAAAAEAGANVLLLEKNDALGRKLRITGKGRCNVTNNCTVQEFIRNVPVNGRFLYGALSRFSPADTMFFFEGLGVPLKTERGARVFPISDKADDIVSALINNMRKNNVRIKKATVKKLLVSNSTLSAVVTDAGTISCKAAILCTGGASYPLTGSDGSGYILARDVGHTISAIKPSLVPLCAKDDCCAKMQGLSLRNITLSIFDSSGKRVYSELGEMLFTHFGISGPLTLSASAHMRGLPREKYRAVIDLKPALDEAKLDARILRDFDKYHNKDFSNALYDLASKTMIPVLIERSGILPDTKVHSITREQRRKLVNLFKSFELEIIGSRPIDEAIVTSGGVAVSEIIPKTMESKIVSGLYFAGEIIDTDAYTGGFNLQIAWSTAYCAAQAAKVSVGGIQ